MLAAAGRLSATMSKEQVLKVLDSYSGAGIVWGAEFLVPPALAACLARDLSGLGAMIVGANFWSYVDRHRGWAKELVGVDIPVHEFIPWDEMTPEKNLAVVEDFLANKVPEDADLISFIFRDDEWYDWMEVWRARWARVSPLTPKPPTEQARTQDEDRA